jgi:hypothetical protein
VLKQIADALTPPPAVPQEPTLSRAATGPQTASVSVNTYATTL